MPEQQTLVFSDSGKSPEPTAEKHPNEEAISLLLGFTIPKLVGRVRVERHPRAPYLYHARRLNDNPRSPDFACILLRVNIPLTERRDVEIVVHAARACLEILENRTTAVACRERP